MTSQHALNIARLGEVRTDWALSEVRELFALPFSDLLYHAQRVHRQHFDPNEVQISTLLSIKTGACPEDCAYCSQSIRFETGLKSEPLMDLDAVLEKARVAKANGADGQISIDLVIHPAPRAYFPGASLGDDDFVSGYTVPALRANATGSICIGAACERYDAAQAYHDHNWGVWRGVTWDWGASRAGPYGRTAARRRGWSGTRSSCP